MRSTTRRVVATIGAIGAIAVLGAGVASARTSMPAANPSDYAGLAADGQAKEFNVTIKGSKLGGDAMTIPYSNGMMGGMSGNIVVSAAQTKNMTLTQVIRIVPANLNGVTSTITNAFATLSGGNYGSTVITGTALPTSGKSYTVRLWFDEQGTNANLSLKFYTYHS